MVQVNAQIVTQAGEEKVFERFEQEFAFSQIQTIGRIKIVVDVNYVQLSHILETRHRFAGQRRLIDGQIVGFEQLHFGWNQIAGFQFHKIACKKSVLW